MRLFLDEAQHVLPQLVEALERDRPDAVLYDIAAYSARVLAWRWDVPLVQLSPAMVAWDGYEQDMAETPGADPGPPGIPGLPAAFRRLVAGSGRGAAGGAAVLLHSWSAHDAAQPWDADPGGADALVAELRDQGGCVDQ